MKLTFPNPSRSFDESSNRVRFWGYDRAIEVSFFVDVEALRRLSSDLDSTESGFLKTFDASRDRIHEVADKLYVRGGRCRGDYAYVLSVADF
ncbi:MAG: DUF1488 domain-containing protein [Sedimenticolaceae bacterium]